MPLAGGSELLRSPRLPSAESGAGLPERDCVGVKSAREVLRATSGLECELDSLLLCTPALLEVESPVSLAIMNAKVA